MSEDKPKKSGKDREVVAVAAAAGGHLEIELDFLICLFHDVFSALSHCIKCGILFKWVCFDQIYVSFEGRIVFTGLDGAVYAIGKSNDDHSSSSSSMKMNNHRSTNNRHRHHASASSSSSSSPDEIKPMVPNSYLSNTAPEIVLGSKSNHSSSVFIFATLCAHLLLGKPLIKPPDNEEKYMQYVFKILGTPKIMQYNEFSNLPRANTFGTHIKVR
jgi:hypothetical protein